MNGGPNSNRWTVLLVQLSSSKRGLLIAFIISPDKNCFAKHVLIKDEQTQMDSCFNFFLSYMTGLHSEARVFIQIISQKRNVCVCHKPGHGV